MHTRLSRADVPLEFTWNLDDLFVHEAAWEAECQSEATYRRQRQENRDSLFIMAREHPDVQAVLKRFPGAEIIDVKEPEQDIPQPLSENDEESR